MLNFREQVRILKEQVRIGKLMNTTFPKIKKCFLMVFLSIEFAVFLAIFCTTVYCHYFKISPTFTEALFAFGVHLVYSCVAVTMFLGLFYCYCYSKKQIEELKQNIKNDL